MSRSESLKSAFQAAQPDLQNYVIALETENLKLQKQIARLQVQDLTSQNRVCALEQQLKDETKKHGLVFTTIFAGEKPVGSAGDSGAG